MKELVVIIPLHDFSKENISLLNKAVESIPSEVDAYLSVKEGVKVNDIPERLNVISISNGDSFQELVNAGVKYVSENTDAEWFSILEHDDTYSSIWLDNVKKYISFMPEISTFMTFEDITDFNDSKYIGLGNAEAYASAFSNEIGYIDLDCLQNYFDFYLTGSIFNIADWNEVGGLKPLIKLTFWYEWMLRQTYKGKKIFVIPKVCYNHKLNRNGSIVKDSRDNMTDDEVQWWFDLSKKDYFFKEQRNPEKYVYTQGNITENQGD